MIPLVVISTPATQPAKPVLVAEPAVLKKVQGLFSTNKYILHFEGDPTSTLGSALGHQCPFDILKMQGQCMSTLPNLITHLAALQEACDWQIYV